MTDFVLIVSIVSHGKQELVTDSAVRAGSFGGTTLKGRGISSNSIVAALGIDSVKDVVYIVCQRSQEGKIRNSIIQGLSNEKKHPGCIFTVSAGELHRKEGLAIEQGETNMSQNFTHDVINVIVHRGFADDVMDAARQAGAG
ncbi:MAG: transcriptional regulator, partial [Treponema sp.]|nr:transcriptional regulator [Treponema sp.]